MHSHSRWLPKCVPCCSSAPACIPTHPHPHPHALRHPLSAHAYESSFKVSSPAVLPVNVTSGPIVVLEVME